MSYAASADDQFVLAHQASVDARTDFIAKTYLHLAGAIIAFAACCAVILNTPALLRPIMSIFSVQLGALLFFGGFILVSYVAESWARSTTSLGMQYAGLGLYVVAESVFFTPLLLFANQFFPGVITNAAVLTLCVFGGLSMYVLVTKKDFSYLGPALSIASFAALGVILCSFLLGGGLTSGTWFAVAMIVLSAGYILYYTSAVLHQYHIGQHVAAALALFAAVALLFWYMIRLLMALRR